MQKALKAVKTGEVTTAVRNAIVDGLAVKRGQAIGMTGGRLVAATSDAGEAAIALARGMGVEADSAVTVYYGAAVSRADAEELAARLKREFRQAKIEAIAGGQPHYQYLLSVE